MDLALILKMENDRRIISLDEAEKLLASSELVAMLISEFKEKPLYAIWRIIALSEIPYAGSLEYTKRIIDYINVNLHTPYGFSLTGKADDIVPCYNAMLIEAYSKLGYAEMKQVGVAIDWIRKYQVFERGVDTNWNRKGIHKYGGCMKSTPCFLGIAKTVKALIYYDKSIIEKDKDIKVLINKGIEYILSHHLYQRLSDKKPINNHILDIAFPPSYQLNIIELLEIISLTGSIIDERCQDAIGYIKDKRTKDGYWKVNHIYKSDGYTSFDKRGGKAEWASYLLDRYTS